MLHFYRDAAGTKIGFTRQVGPHIVGYLMNGSRVAYYWPQLDITYRPDGARIGYGNMVPGLILQAAR